MSKLVIQMYSLRQELADNPEKLFKELSDRNMNVIQLDGMRGHKEEYIKSLLDRYNIKVDSMHIKHQRFFDDLEGIVKECQLFDSYEIYCKYIEDEFQNEEGYRATKKQLIVAAKYLKEKGITVGLHSPEYDFNNEIDGQKVMDFICEDITNGLIVEPDTYWLSVANIDPLYYIKKYPNRIKTLHLKDIDLSKDLLDMKDNIRECGQGDVDFKSIISWGIRNGIESFAIEQDYSKKNMIESMQESFDYLSLIINEAGEKN